ncbi:hypothetical protein IW261DRAFT_1025843 [Armillaria novae-zelandiae]|uniref:RING-type domain-containing protein n=1 Tax=Armillaria novae-zelandiae TaxID=153914 RepID=A0AA39PDI7_9AGAR|nr:hypothetical protein IW261DRAFT_1025843 [Armillaria novae-zelandiae]
MKGSEEKYPDEVSETGDEPLETSWEDSNEYDFEDPEYLRLLPFSASNFLKISSPSAPDCYFQSSAAADGAEESDEKTSHFSCPMCQKKEQSSLCTTPCGHVYCARCIRAALTYTKIRPVCDGRATEDQLSPEDIYLPGVTKLNGSVVWSRRLGGRRSSSVGPVAIYPNIMISPDSFILRTLYFCVQSFMD